MPDNGPALSSFEGLPPGKPDCAPPSPISGTEIKGTSKTGGELHGLIFQNGPITAGQEVKIAWRITGTDDLVTSITSPSGEPGKETFGPEYHGGSNYNRPGGEWGTGYSFNVPGCWHLHFARHGNDADAWINVLPSK